MPDMDEENNEEEANDGQKTYSSHTDYLLERILLTLDLILAELKTPIIIPSGA